MERERNTVSKYSKILFAGESELPFCTASLNIHQSVRSLVCWVTSLCPPVCLPDSSTPLHALPSVSVDLSASLYIPQYVYQHSMIP